MRNHVALCLFLLIAISFIGASGLKLQNHFTSQYAHLLAIKNPVNNAESIEEKLNLQSSFKEDGMKRFEKNIESVLIF